MIKGLIKRKEYYNMLTAHPAVIVTETNDTIALYSIIEDGEDTRFSEYCMSIQQAKHVADSWVNIKSDT